MKTKNKYYRNTLNSPPPRTGSPNFRMGMVFIIAFCCFMVVAAKLVYLQIIHHSYYSNLARKNAENKRVIPARRGSIMDRRGRMLAKDVLHYSVAVSGKYLKNRSKTVSTLSQVLNLSPAHIDQKIRGNRNFVYLAHKVLPNQAEKFRELKDPGVVLEKRFLRVYPYASNGAHVLGFCDVDNQPLGGIEFQYNDYLQGKKGWSIFQKDALGTQLPDLNYQGEDPIDGFDIALTIDIDYQIILDDELRAAVEKYRAADGIAILMDPHSGAVLALSNYPTFQPSQPNRYDSAVLKNRALSDVFEPGSTFKIITLAAALEVLQLNLDQDIFFCENGRYKLYGQVFTDYKGYGWLTARKVFENSSNIGAVKIAEKLKKDVFFKYIRNFGFGIPSGIDLPGESTGIVNPFEKWSRASHLFLSFGYEVGVTPLQLASAYTVVANGGNLMKPYVMKNITRENNRVIIENSPSVIRRVLSPQTTEIMNGVLMGVVENGSGREARLEAVNIAGKTGTAQLYDLQSGRHNTRKHLASFAGYFPSYAPQFVLLIMIRQPQGSYYGGLVAAPVFRRVAQRILDMGDIQRNEIARNTADSGQDKDSVIPDLKNFNRDIAEKMLKELDIKVRFFGEGNRITRQENLKEDGRTVGVNLYLAESSLQSEKVMPVLTGKSLKEALNMLAEIDLLVDVDGHGVVVSQHPKPGSRITDKKSVKLVCKPS